MVLKPPQRVVDLFLMDTEQNGVQLPGRQERLAELGRQISEGTYLIPAEWVAESILLWRGRSGRRN